MRDQNILLLIYFVAFFLLALVIRSVLVYRNTGINPLVLPRTQDAYGYVGMAFKVLMLGCAGVVTLRGCGRLRIELGALESQIEANWQNLNYFELNKFNLEAIVITKLPLVCLAT